MLLPIFVSTGKDCSTTLNSERFPNLSGLRDAGLEPLYRAAIAVAAIAGAVMFFVEPLLTTLVVFGVALSPDQTEAIANLVRALAGLGAPLAVAAIARPQVSSPKTVSDILHGPDGVPAGPAVDYDLDSVSDNVE